MNKPQLTKEQIMKIPEMAKTYTGKEIAIYFNVPYTTVHAWVLALRKRGVKVVWGRQSAPLSILDK